MRNEETEDIKDIIRQLNALQLEQSLLLVRLQRATEGKNDGATKNHETTKPRPLKIGDRVKINNPRPLQPTGGRITRIGKLVTVTAQSGVQVVRASKNLTLLE